MISISELHKEFIVDDGKVVALNKLNIEVNAGEFFVIVGASGSGKTTLLRSVAGLETPDSGKINISERTIFSNKPAIGLSAVRTSWRILVPLLRPTLMSVWIWSAILVYRELTVAVFLAGHDNITLPAVIWSYWQSSAINLAAGATLVMTVLLTPLILIFWWFGRKSVMEG